MKAWRVSVICLCVGLFVGEALGQQRFADLVGPVTAQPVKQAAELQVPFITWGGDVATFLANGGLTTKTGSIYNKQGLKIRLTNGDDFVGQVKDYMSGKTPFLRGTFRMLGQASEVLGSDPKTKPVVILQLTWSAGDHVVARENLKTLNDLKKTTSGKVKIACQQGGPHVGLLDDMLRASQIDWSDVEIVWAPDLTGDNGPAALFRKDPSIGACCVISPDMIGLTGGLDSKGSGAEGTVKGAHVLVSTAQMSRSIADVYAVRSDWFQANRAVAEKFVAGYLAASQQIVPMRKAFEDTGRLTPQYKALLTMGQDILGEDVLPTLEVDAHGLLLDCTFVGLPGNISFFMDKGNLNGFDAKLKAALDLATGQGYAKVRTGFVPAGFDYQQIAKVAGIEYVEPGKTAGKIDAEAIDLFPDSVGLDDQTILSFTISFEPNQSAFPPDRYGAEFNRAIQSASTFGNAVVVIRGHSDPTKTLVDLIRAGIAKGVIQRSGARPNYKYFVRVGGQSQPLDLKQTKRVAELIKAGEFDGAQTSPRETMQAALNLSQARAEAVRDAVVKFAKQQDVNLDASQMQPVGAGILEPLVSKPRNMDEAKQNMRVEFRIVKVPAEAISESDFDF
jgi:ABC-type nitrate/sulfonate/bicarbonate transport system substrate-binding protein